MPLLKGKSSHGSKPMTSLSFTFSWMPHCCPQKQQCVLTSRSGSTEESARWPVGYAFNGPNLASSSGVRGGSAAISPSRVISYQLSAISYQLSVISYQLSVISYQLSVISYQLSVISYQDRSSLPTRH